MPDEVNEPDTRIQEFVLKRLQEIIGNSGWHAVLWRLENRYGIMPSDVVDAPLEFIHGLTAIFGEGARILESNLVVEMCVRFGLRRSRIKSFPEVVNIAKKRARPVSFRRVEGHVARA